MRSDKGKQLRNMLTDFRWFQSGNISGSNEWVLTSAGLQEREQSAAVDGQALHVE